MSRISSVRSSAGSRRAPQRLQDLPSYRLNRLAYLWSRIAADTNQTQYGVGPRDWRILALLAADAPMSLNDVARSANIDKSQASRSVAQLIERGLVARQADAQDGRGVSLELTDEGLALYATMFPAAIARNDQLLQVLTPEENAQFDDMLNRLTARALEVFTQSQALARPRRGRRAGPR